MKERELKLDNFEKERMRRKSGSGARIQKISVI